MTTAAQAQLMIDHGKANAVILPGAGTRDGVSGGGVVSGGDMRSVANPSWWGGNTLASTQTYWNHFQPWYVVWDVAGHQAGLNVRVAIRDKEFWVLFDTGVWQRLSYVRGPVGDPFARDTVTSGGDATGRRESDGTWSIKITPGGSIYHGYQGGVSTGTPQTVRAVHTRCLARKIIETAGGPDQRDLARYAVQMGLDKYPNSSGSLSQVGATYWPGASYSRFIEVGNDWTPIYNTSLASARAIDNAAPYNFRQTISDVDFLANPPPVAGWLPEAGGETTPPVIPPVVVPPPTGIPLVARWFDRDDGSGAYSWIQSVTAGGGGTTADATQDDDMLTIKQSEATAARRRVYFDCLDATDGYTPETGLTFSSGELKISKAGAAEANHAGTVAEVGGGTYYYEFTAAEVNTLGVMQFRVVKSGVRGFRVRVQVTGVDVHDAVAGGMTNLAVSTGDLLQTSAYVNPLTQANGVETGWTLQGALRYLLAAHAKRSGVGSTTEVYRAITDSKARITLTVDGSGNVTNVVADLT
jgi:hypothetical protein